MYVRDRRKRADGTPIPDRQGLPSPWECTYRDKGGVRHNKVFATEGAAKRWGREREVEVDQGQHIDPRDAQQLFGPYAEAWLARRVVAPTTAYSDGHRFDKHVLPTWRNYPLEAISHSAVQDWVHRLGRQGLGAWSVRSAVNLLGGCLDAAVKDKALRSNPVRGLTLPTPPSGKDVYLTHDEVDALADAMRQRRPGPRGEFDALVLLMLANTGMRWSELAGLEVRHVNMLRRQITVESTLDNVGGRMERKGYTKGVDRRHVPLADELVAPLAAHLAAHPTYRDEYGELIFRPNALDYGLGRGRALRDQSWTRAAFRPAVAAVFGCRPGDTKDTWIHDQCSCNGVRVHDLRHTYASWLVQNGVDLAVIQKMLGHHSVVTTQRYAHLRPDAGEQVRTALRRAK